MSAAHTAPTKAKRAASTKPRAKASVAVRKEPGAQSASSKRISTLDQQFTESMNRIREREAEIDARIESIRQILAWSVPRTPISKLVETIVKVETIQEQMVTLAALIEQFSIRLKAVERHVQATTREQGWSDRRTVLKDEGKPVLAARAMAAKSTRSPQPAVAKKTVAPAGAAPAAKAKPPLTEDQLSARLIREIRKEKVGLDKRLNALLARVS